MNLRELAEPFGPSDLEWRVQRAGNKNGKVWAMLVPYITNRAIMDRLDNICEPVNWRNEFAPGPTGGTLCGISIRVEGEWVTKWDGAENTDIEAVKGGLSGAMKRAGVQWGIGRYLYRLEEAWANVHDKGVLRGQYKDGGNTVRFNYDPPRLPKWALPGDGADTETEVAGERVDTTTGEVLDDEPADNKSRAQLAGLLEALAAAPLSDKSRGIADTALKLAEDGGPQDRVDKAIKWATELVVELELGPVEAMAGDVKRLS